MVQFTRKVFNNWRGIVVSALCMLSSVAGAQTASVNNVTVTSSANTVNTGSTINVLNGTNATAVYTFTASVNSADAEPSNPTFTYKINNGTTQTGSIRLSGSTLSIGTVTVPLNTVGEYSLSFTVTYQYKVYSGSGDNQTITTQTRTINGTAPKTVKVWATPSVNHPTVNSSVLTGSSNNFSVSASGGNPDGWSYSWAAPNKTGSASTFNYSPTNNSSAISTVNVTVTAQNVGPDGSTIWYTDIYTYPLSVYPTPSATLDSSANALYSGNTAEFTATTSGGNPTGWEYLWSSSHTSVTGTDKTFVYTAPNNNTTAAITDKITLNIKNSAPTTRDNWFNNTLIKEVTVYPKPELTLSCPLNDIFQYKSTTLTAAVSGGQLGKWTYEWYVNGQKQSVTDNKFEYTATLAMPYGEGSRPTEIEVIATNNADGVSSPAVLSRKHIINVWSAPSLLQTNAFPGQYSGEELTLEATPTFGNPDGWENYSWTRNGVLYVQGTGKKSIDIIETVDSETQFEYILSATNSLENGQTEYLQTEFHVTYYPTPSATISNDHNAILSGDASVFNVAVQGGQSDKWTYEWSIDGQIQTSTEPTFTYNADNNITAARTVRIACTVHNNADNVATPFTTILTKEIIVYPTPNYTISAPLNQSAFSDESLNLEVTLEGGNPNGWAYKRSQNGTIIDQTNLENDDNIRFAETLSGIVSPQSNSYDVQITNSVDGVERLNATFSYTFTFYPTPTVDFFLPNGRTNWVVGDEISVEANIDGGNPDSWVYAWNNGIDTEGSAKTFTFRANNNGEAGKVNALILNATNAPEYIITPFTQEVNQTYTVWNQPEAFFAKSTTQAVFSGQDITLAITSEGGLPTGWNYVWTRDGVTLSNEGLALTENFNVTATETHTYTVTATNSMDGIEVYNETFTFDVTIYPTPTVKFNLPNGRTNWVAGDEITVSAVINGGDPNAWIFNWNDGGFSTGNAQNFTFTANNLGDSGKNYELTLNSINSPTNIVEPYVNDISQIYTVWNTPKATMSVPERQAVFSGQPATMSVAIDGGLPTGWKYLWTCDGIPVTATNSLTQSFDVTTTSSHIYVLHVTNTMDGVEVYAEDFTFELITYPTPTAIFNLPEGRSAYMASEEIHLQSVISGGEENSWSLNWTIDGTELTTHTENIAVGPLTEGNHTLLLTATNAPADILAPAVIQYSQTIHVYADGSISNASISPRSAFSGQEMPFRVDVENGNPSGWSYSWSVERPDGVVVGNDVITNAFAYAPSVDNESHYTVRCRVRNTLDGIVFFDQTQEFEAVYYPTPDINLVMPSGRTAWISGENLDILTSISGGNPDAWHYVWTLDGVQYATDDAINIIAENSQLDDDVIHKVKLQATNSPDNILVPFTKTLTADLIIWPQPAVEAITGADVAAFSGETIPFLIAVHGGVNGNWTTTWSYTADNGTSDSASDFGAPKCQYDYTQTSSEIVNGTITVNVINTLDGEEKFNQSLMFTAKYFPTPTATFDLPQPREDWMNGETIVLDAEVNGGDASAWTYSWSLDEEQKSSNSNYECVVENTAENGFVNRTIKLTAVNTPANLVTEPISITTIKNIKVWASGNSGIATLQHQAAYSGEEITFAVAPSGGFADGWSYIWTQERNGEQPIVNSGSNPSLTISRIVSNPEETKVTLEVTNSIQGNTFYTQTYNFDATFYPTPLATDNLSNLRSNWMNTEEVEMTSTVQGGASTAWTTQWSVDGEVVSSASEAIYKAENLAETDSHEHTLSVRIVNQPANILTPYVFIDSKVITVWPSAGTERQQNAPAYFSGQSVEIGVIPSGGDPAKWTYEWTRNSVALSESSAIHEFVADNTATAPCSTDVYTVTARNTLDGVVVFSKQTSYTIDTYLTPEAGIETDLFNLYFGDEVTLRSQVAGGNPDGWSYSWNTAPTTTSTANITYSAQERNTDAYTDSRTVTITNTYEDLEWYSREFTVNINVWKYPEINVVELATEDYNATADLTLRTTQTGGDATTWTYSWSLDGKIINGANASSLPVDFENNGSELVTLIYQLTATNKLQNHDEFSKTMTYVLRVWPRIHLNSEIDIPTPQIRQDNIFNAYTEPMPSGGYDLFWTYDWKIDGQQYSTDPDIQYVMTMQTSGEAMQTQEHTYNLHVANPGPEGSVWQEKDCTPKTVTVYRRPRTPQRLVRKGDGTSHTLIAMISELDDAQLATNLYTFTFGYTDNSGQDHSLSNGTSRYIHIDPDVYNNSSNRFWVYTLWSYTDGSLVSSGRRYLSGDVDEQFDASVYSDGGRGPQANLNEIKTTNDGIFTDGYAFAIDVTTPCDVCVKIYNTAGMMVAQQQYSHTSKMKATLGLEKLVPGNYIVEITAGENRKTIKASTGRFNR